LTINPFRVEFTDRSVHLVEWLDRSRRFAAC